MRHRLRNRTFISLGMVWGYCAIVAGRATTMAPTKGPNPAAATALKTWSSQDGSTYTGNEGSGQEAPVFRLPKPTTVNANAAAAAVPLHPADNNQVLKVAWESTSDGQTVERHLISGSEPRTVFPVQATDSQPAGVSVGIQGGVSLEVHGGVSVVEPPVPGPGIVADQPGAPVRRFWSNRGGHHLHSGDGAVAGGMPGPRDDVPNELRKVLLPTYVVGPPDVLEINLFQKIGLIEQPVRGPHVIRPDGTIGLGIYGSVRVAGLTLEQAHLEIAKVIKSKLSETKTLKEILDKSSVDVLAFNSQLYFIITDGGGFGEQVFPMPVTGNETVLSAIGKISGLPPVASKKHIWVARRTLGHTTGDNILPVDWCGITQRGESQTNYQILPGDRIYVQADRLITLDRTLQKILQPIERVFGMVLLGSQTVNSIRAKTQ